VAPAVAAFAAAALAVAVGASPTLAQEGPSDPGLTIYMQNTALVRATIERPIRTGEQTVRLDGLPANIDLESLVVLDPGLTLLGVHDRRTYQSSGSGNEVSLALDVRAASAMDGFRVAFLTGGLGWDASYAMHVAADDRSARIGGYATIDNGSGADFERAAVQLLAGTVNVEGGGGRYRPMAEMRMADAAAQAPSVSREAFAGYHLYDVDVPLTLESGATRRIRLMGADAIPVAREYVLAGQVNHYQVMPEPQRQEAVIRYRVERPEGTSFADLPLPAGTVRLYQEDGEGRVQLLGADGIPNSSPREDLYLTVGRAFDIGGTRTQTDFERVAGDVRESAWEVELVNRTDEDVVVQVIEELRGDWEILDSSHEARQLSATRVRFDVPVAADGEAAWTTPLHAGMSTSDGIRLAWPSLSTVPSTVRNPPLSMRIRGTSSTLSDPRAPRVTW